MSITTRETSPISRLNHEWATRYATRPAASADGRSWHQDHPALTGCQTLQDVLDRLRLSPTADANRILHALLVLGRDGEQDALRTALEAELGVLPWLGRQARARGHEDYEAIALEALWGTIRQYPLRRLNVAANLKMDALKAVARAVPADARSGVADVDLTTLAASAPQDDPAQEACQLLEWARTRELLPPLTLDLIARVHLQQGPTDWATISAEFGGNYEAIKKRYARGVRTLAAAVREALAADASPAVA